MPRWRPCETCRRPITRRRRRCPACQKVERREQWRRSQRRGRGQVSTPMGYAPEMIDTKMAASFMLLGKQRVRDLAAEGRLVGAWKHPDSGEWRIPLPIVLLDTKGRQLREFGNGSLTGRMA